VCVWVCVWGGGGEWLHLLSILLSCQQLLNKPLQLSSRVCAVDQQPAARRVQEKPIQTYSNCAETHYGCHQCVC